MVGPLGGEEGWSPFRMVDERTGGVMSRVGEDEKQVEPRQDPPSASTWTVLCRLPQHQQITTGPMAAGGVHVCSRVCGCEGLRDVADPKFVNKGPEDQTWLPAPSADTCKGIRDADTLIGAHLRGLEGSLTSPSRTLVPLQSADIRWRSR